MNINDGKTYRIKKAIDKGDFVQVTLNTSDTLLIPLEDYFMNAFKINDAIDVELIHRYSLYQEVFSSYIRIKNRIYQKDYSCYEVKTYCKSHFELDELQLSALLEMIDHSNLLDDHMYALNKSSYWQQNGYSINEVRHKLQDVRIDEKWIHEACEKLDDELEWENACKCANKYKNTIKGKSIRLYKQNLIQKIVQKGFSYDMANAACDTLTFDDDMEKDALISSIKKAKRMYNKDKDNKNKIINYCLRKGFTISQIREELEGETDD